MVFGYTMMDRILKEERNYIFSMVKKIKATGCNMLLIVALSIQSKDFGGQGCGKG